MPSILTHPAVPLAIGLGLGARVIPPRLIYAGIAASIVPDLDVYLERFTSSIGHRGLTHSLAFALLGGLCAALIARALRTTHRTAFFFIFAATISHPLLDMCTNGGAGVTLFWPLTLERYFLPWTPIEVSPLGVTRFFSERGAEVLASEAVWVWLPAAVVAGILWAARSLRPGGGEDPF